MKLWTGMLVATCCLLLHHAGAAPDSSEDSSSDEPLNCKDRVDKERARDESRPIADKEYPQCDSDGNYKTKQCYGRWTIGHCGCYESISGDRIRDILGVPYRSTEARAMTCNCAVHYQNVTERAEYCDRHTGDYKAVRCNGEVCSCYDRVSGGKFKDIEGVGYRSLSRRAMTCKCAIRYRQNSADRARYCDLQTGDYKAMRCCGPVCYCAHRSGEVMTNFVPFLKASPNPSNCMCARGTADLHGLMGVELLCNKEGGFESRQCLGSVCYCVDRMGKQVTPSVPRNRYKYLNCPKRTEK